MTFVFIIIGIVITSKVNQISKNKNIVLDEELLKNYKESLFKLWVVITVFTIVCMFLLGFDIVGYLSTVPSCDALTDSIIGNNVLWFLSRSISDYLWIVPLIIIFFP